MGSLAEVEKEFFRMMKGGSFFSLVKDEVVVKEIREVLASKMGYLSPLQPEPGQPFLLGLMASAGDCDHAFLGHAGGGLALGVLNPLPRTPGVYEEQTKWALEPDMEATWATEKENYKSAEQYEERLWSHLEKEVEEGLVVKMTEKEFEEKYGGCRACGGARGTAGRRDHGEEEGHPRCDP